MGVLAFHAGTVAFELEEAAHDGGKLLVGHIVVRFCHQISWVSGGDGLRQIIGVLEPAWSVVNLLNEGEYAGILGNTRVRHDGIGVLRRDFHRSQAQTGRRLRPLHLDEPGGIAILEGGGVGGIANQTCGPPAGQVTVGIGIFHGNDHGPGTAEQSGGVRGSFDQGRCEASLNGESVCPLGSVIGPVEMTHQATRVVAGDGILILRRAAAQQTAEIRLSFLRFPINLAACAVGRSADSAGYAAGSTGVACHKGVDGMDLLERLVFGAEILDAACGHGCLGISAAGASGRGVIICTGDVGAGNQDILEFVPCPGAAHQGSGGLCGGNLGVNQMYAGEFDGGRRGGVRGFGE